VFVHFVCSFCSLCDLFQSFFTIEERGGFFKGPVLSLDEEEPQEDELDGKPADIYELNMTDEKKIRASFVSETYVVLPRQGVKCNWVYILIENERKRDD
jgi:hypothetical protein